MIIQAEGNNMNDSTISLRYIFWDFAPLFTVIVFVVSVSASSSSSCLPFFVCSLDVHFEITPRSECKKTNHKCVKYIKHWSKWTGFSKFLLFSTTSMFRLKWAIHKLFQFPIVIIHRPNNHKLSRFMCTVGCCLLFIRF